MGGFLLSLLSKLNSLWKCPDQRFGLLSPSLTYIDRRSVNVRVRFRFRWVLAADRRRFYRQCSDNDPWSTLSTREAKNRQLSAQTVRLEPWSSGHYRLLSRPGQAWEILLALCGAARGPLFDPACVHYSHAYVYMYDSRATFPPNVNTKAALVCQVCVCVCVFIITTKGEAFAQQ